MKDFKSVVIAILIFLVIVCGLWGVIEIVKGLVGEAFDILENIFY